MRFNFFVLVMFAVVCVGFPDIATVKRAIVIPSVIPITDIYIEAHSLGDELLLLGTVFGVISSALYDEVYFQICSRNTKFEKCSLIEKRVQTLSQQYIVEKKLKNVTVIPVVEKSNYLFDKRINLTTVASRFDGVYMIAADCMDGYYSCDRSLARWSMYFGASALTKAYLVSTSFDMKKTSHCPALVHRLQAGTKAIQTASSIWIRDRKGYDDLAMLLGARFMKEHVGHSADVAFLVPLLPLERDSEIIPLLASLSKIRQSGGRILGININVHFISGIPLTKVVTPVAKAICEIAAQEEANLHVLYLPHEFRPQQSDAKCGQVFVETLVEVCPSLPLSRIHFTGNLTIHAMEAKHLISHADMVFTSRMHVSLSAVEMGIPVAFIASHQNKFEYFQDMFGISGASLPKTSNWTDSRVVAEFMASRWRVRTSTRDAVVRSRNIAYALATAPFLSK